MSDQHDHDAAAARHEADTVPADRVLWATVALVVLLVVVLFAMQSLFGLFAARTSEPDDYWQAQPAAPPDPDQPAQLRQLREAEQRLLNESAWLPEQPDTARIPIEEAKKLLLERGLPARTPVKGQ